MLGIHFATDAERLFAHRAVESVQTTMFKCLLVLMITVSIEHPRDPFLIALVKFLNVVTFGTYDCLEPN